MPSITWKPRKVKKRFEAMSPRTRRDIPQFADPIHTGVVMPSKKNLMSIMLVVLSILVLSAGQAVAKTNTTTTLASSLNPSTYGSSVTFTATVSPSTATGTVTFKNGTTTLGTGTLSGGKATYSTSTLAVGSNSITASYGGDTNDNSSTSTALTQTVNKATTTTTLASSLNPSTYRFLGDLYGHGVTFDGDRDGDLQGWDDDAGHGHAQQREGHLQHFDAGGGIAFDHGFLRRGHERQQQHFYDADANGEQSDHDDHAGFIAESLNVSVPR